MVSPYEKCPIYENENYLLRLVETTDASDLLQVYSDEKSVPYFNSDNCNGDDFHYTTLERMQSAIDNISCRLVGTSDLYDGEGERAICLNYT